MIPINRRIDPNRTMRYGVPLIRSSIFSASGYLILRYTAKELFNICMSIQGIRLPVLYYVHASRIPIRNAGSIWAGLM